METKENRQQILAFCEDCGQKNFINLEQAEKKGNEVTFRCQSCNYLNTVSVPAPSPKTS